jgi:hypothetical protein
MHLIDVTVERCTLVSINNVSGYCIILRGQVELLPGLVVGLKDLVEAKRPRIHGGCLESRRTAVVGRNLRVFGKGLSEAQERTRLAGMWPRETARCQSTTRMQLSAI